MSPEGQEPWRETPLPGHAWRPVYPEDRRFNSQQQDQTAGGRSKRLLELNGQARALSRIKLAPAGGRRVYAYLLWHEDGARRELYLGEATHGSRDLNLRAAWQIVRDNQLNLPARRRAWTTRREGGGAS